MTGSKTLYSYLHFNTGWGDNQKNAYYLLAGTHTADKQDAENISEFEYLINNQIITNIKR